MKLLSVRDVADYLAMSEISIRRMIRSGQLPHTRLNRTVRVPLAAVQRVVENNTVSGQ